MLRVRPLRVLFEVDRVREVRAERTRHGHLVSIGVSAAVAEERLDQARFLLVEVVAAAGTVLAVGSHRVALPTSFTCLATS
jgi:hypothetical protein